MKILEANESLDGQLSKEMVGKTNSYLLESERGSTRGEQFDFSQYKSPGSNSADSAAKRDIPCAIKSALIKFWQLAYLEETWSRASP